MASSVKTLLPIIPAPVKILCRNPFQITSLALEEEIPAFPGMTELTGMTDLGFFSDPNEYYKKEKQSLESFLTNWQNKRGLNSS